MHRLAAVWVALVLAGPVWADALTDRLLEAVQMPRLLAQLAFEADQSAGDIDRDFLQGNGGAILYDTVARLNAPERLLPMVQQELTRTLDAETREAVTLFFESRLGQEIATLELSARATYFEPDVEAAIQDRLTSEPLRDAIGAIISDGDLVDRNVADSVEALRQFYQGLTAGMGGASAAPFPPGALEVFLTEMTGAMREDTRAWLEGFMTLAYSPLSDTDVETYAAFWQTQAGQAYDRALFDTFRVIFAENGFALGQLVGRLQVSDEI